MKSTKQLSSVALLSVLALTGCTNSDDAAKNDTAPVTAGTPVTPEEQPTAIPDQSGSVSSIEQGGSSETQQENTGTTNQMTDSGSARSADGSAASKDIIKTGQVNYKTPAGDDLMRVNITATTDGIIAGVLVTPLSTNDVSLKFQQEFANKVGKDVIGKKLKGLKIDTVSGASLTTGAFNDFLAKNSN